MSAGSDPLGSASRAPAETGPRPAETPARAFEVGGLKDVRWLRHRVQATLAESGLSLERVADFVVAVSEVATNAVVHGLPPVAVRMWSTPGTYLCAVTDHGPGFDEALAGHAPARDDLANGGMGLWLARQLCDELTTTRTGAGFTVLLTINC